MNTDMFVPELQVKLDLLEKRIRQILDHVSGLKRVNNRLKQEMDDLREQLELERSNSVNALAEVERWKTEVLDLKTTRDQVTGSIENLLELIDELQMDLDGKPPLQN